MKKVIILFIFSSSFSLCMHNESLSIQDQDPLDVVFSLEDALHFENVGKKDCRFLLKQCEFKNVNKFVLKSLINSYVDQFVAIRAIRETCQELGRPSSARDAMPKLKALGFVEQKKQISQGQVK